MTNERITTILDLYQRTLSRITWTEHTVPELEHVIEMIPKMRSMDGEKLHRWLGFVQGVLYCQRVYTIEEMKEHNR